MFNALNSGPSEENSIESIIDNGKTVGSANGSDISNAAVQQPAQLSIATVNASNADTQQVSPCKQMPI